MTEVESWSIDQEVYTEHLESKKETLMNICRVCWLLGLFSKQTISSVVTKVS